MNNEETTSDAARAAAFRVASEWLDSRGGRLLSSEDAASLRAEANRLETAAKTLGQVLMEAMGAIPSSGPAGDQGVYEGYAAAVVAHFVGPDGVLVNRADLEQVSNHVLDCEEAGLDPAAKRLLEALP